MSHFDEENPFGEPVVDNPFADPSVQQITKKPPNIQEGLEDYNPFATDQTSSQRSAAVRGAANPPLTQYNSGPAVVTPTVQDVSRQPPPYAKSSQQIEPPLLTTTELQKRQEELDRKAAELERREQELRRNETNVRKNNFPPLPSWFCWQPCFFMDISVEVQPQFQKIVRYLLHLWYFHSGLLLANILGSMLLLFHRGEFERFILSIFYAVLFTPVSFLCWFRPGYKAFKDDSSFNFMMFFFIFFFQFLVSVDEALGFQSSGFCGLITALSLFDGSPSGALVGVLILVIALGFCCAACFDIILLTKIHRIYRGTGASFAKAQAEFTSEFFRNEHVQNAATNVAQAAVRSQFSQPQQQPPSNRY